MTSARAFVGASLLAASACGLNIAACASTPDGGGLRLGDAAAADASNGDAAARIEACFEKCDKTHPAAIPKYDAIDDCWVKSCKAPCIDQSGSFDAGASTKVNDGGANICGTTMPSFTDKACDDCTEAFCCPSWKGCYDDADCVAYDLCIVDCFPQR